MSTPLVRDVRQVGDVEVTALWDADWSFVPAELVPDVAAADWLPYVDAGAERVPSRVLSFLLRDPQATILVDLGVGVGNGWPDGRLPEALAQAGAETSEVDVVVVTHLHSDHVGGGTRMAGGARVPLLPRARHLFPRNDWVRFTDEHHLASSRNATSAAIVNSALVLAELGLVDLVDPPHPVTAAVDLVATPGHTPGSLSVRIRSQGRTAFLIGDAAHHEAQLARPDWSSFSDMDPAAAAASRRWIAEEALRADALVAGAHFGASAPVFARMADGDDGVRWNPLRRSVRDEPPASSERPIRR